MPKTFGQYVLLERIDRAGGADIYLARQTTVDRLVTVTILPQRHAGKSAFSKRFERQIAAASRVAHPNIVCAIDAGTRNGHQYIIAEHAGGKRLSEALDRGEWFPIRRCVAMGLDLAKALAHLSNLRILHRSVNPRTVVLAESGVTKLRGFSLSKLMEGDSSETWFELDTYEASYVSPESARGVDRLDARTDLYSLGCVLYHVVTGRPPFAGSSLRALFESQIHDETPDPRALRQDLPDDLCRVLEKCLEKDRDRRYQTAAALVRDLETLQRPSTAAASDRGLAPLRWLASMFQSTD